jgi:hypothetical protein
MQNPFDDLFDRLVAGARSRLPGSPDWSEDRRVAWLSSMDGRQHASAHGRLLDCLGASWIPVETRRRLLDHCVVENPDGDFMMAVPAPHAVLRFMMRVPTAEVRAWFARRRRVLDWLNAQQSGSLGLLVTLAPWVSIAARDRLLDAHVLDDPLRLAEHAPDVEQLLAWG